MRDYSIWFDDKSQIVLSAENAIEAIREALRSGMTGNVIRLEDWTGRK